jgi:hypothetical protein
MACEGNIFIKVEKNACPSFPSIKLQQSKTAASHFACASPKRRMDRPARAMVWGGETIGCGCGDGGVSSSAADAASDPAGKSKAEVFGLVSLPFDLAARMLATLPPHCRARCAAVSRSWRAMLREIPPVQLWRELDFTMDPSCKVRP